MNKHTNWMSDNKYFGDNFWREYVIDEAKSRFDTQRYYSAEGYEVIVDDEYTEDVVVQWYTNPLNANREDVKIHFSTDSNINRGSYIDWEGNKYIIAAKVKNNQAYKSSQMLECNNYVKFYDENHEYHELPCVLTSKNSSSRVLSNDKYIITEDDNTIALVQYNSSSKKIPVKNDNRRLLFNGQAYMVEKFDNFTNVNINGIGFVELRLNADTISEYDDLVNNIADANKPYTPPSPTPTTELVITGDSEVKYGQTKTFTANKYVDGSIVAATFTFSIIAGSTPSSAYTLSVVDGNNITIKCNEYTYSITLRATEDGTGDYVEKTIQLKGLL